MSRLSADLTGYIDELSRAGRVRRGWRRHLPRLLRYPLGVAGLMVLLVVLGLAFFGPSLAPHDPYATDATARLQAPSAVHLMGTDQLGRDVLSRVMYAARPAAIIGFGSLAIGLLLGATVGAISGYFGGPFDLLVQRIADAFMSMPSLVLGLTVIAVLGPGRLNLVLAVGFVIAPVVQRVVRASTMSVKQQDYVEAATVLGAGHTRILSMHILPNILSPVIVIASVELGSAILIEASLSFLGYGVPPPEPSWGGMLSAEGRRFMVGAPWLVIFPAIAVSAAVLGINLLGDALRDALDPRLRK